MIIGSLKTNRLTNPCGYDLGTPTLSYIVEEAKGKKQAWARVWVSLDENFEKIIYDSGKQSKISSLAFPLDLKLEAESRYYWKVQVCDDAGDTAVSPAAWFETPKAGKWEADWITPDLPEKVQALVYTEVQVKKPVKKARAYMVGLGLYEFYLNGEKQGRECLLPGFCDYDSWIQYQTYELDLLPGNNKIEMMLGDGWYKGIYGMQVKEKNYGDRLAAIAEIKIWYEDGSMDVIKTDESWKAKKSPVIESGIYSGETFDASLKAEESFAVKRIDLDKKKLSARLSPALVINDEITPIAVLHTPAGETVLDMGQNMVGWLTFKTSAPRGSRIHLQFGEILQEGNFYRDNLRSARAEYTYISGGEPDQLARQYFTFYGFRYVKVNGWPGEIKKEDFKGLVIHSKMEKLGHIETSDALVNQLFKNTWWGQKGNFLDVPTDCPQRDERYGWTGDAQIFSGTACFNMDTYAFYTKYCKDIYAEQLKLGGSVPDVVPVANYPGDASTGWADAAVIIPWNVYLHYGDVQILARQYPSMKAWVDYMKREDEKDGSRRLWLTGYHYADWLALDGNYPGGVFGATDPGMIASAFYYYSTTLLAKAAGVLHKKEDQAAYQHLAEEIRQAFLAEYFTANNRLAVDTMTAYTLVLYFHLMPENAGERMIRGLFNKLKSSRYHLETGFLGTPYLCRVLSDNGLNDLAYHLLLEKGYPGWLYEVLMGATTVWERWNSVLPDGRISSTGMNSLNHYSYGSIVEWMYRNMIGIRPCEEQPGFKTFLLAPQPDYRIQSAEASIKTAAGKIGSQWKIEGGKLTFRFEVPFDSQAEVILPDADISMIDRQEGMSAPLQSKENVIFTCRAGSYTFTYQPTKPLRKIYSIDSPLCELEENPKTRKILEEEYYSLISPRTPMRDELYTLDENMHSPFTWISKEQQQRIDEMLKNVEE